MQNFFKHHTGTSENRVAAALRAYNDKWHDIAITHINDALELFNIYLCVDERINNNTISDSEKESLETISSISLRNIGRFVSSFNDQNIASQTKEVQSIYKDDYLHLLGKYRVFNRISHSVFASLLSDGLLTLKRVLSHKDIVEQYDTEIADYMRSRADSAEIIAHFLWGKNPSNISLPKSLSHTERCLILEQYTELDLSRVHPSVLDLIQRSKNVDGFITTDELKLKAKEKNSAYWKAALKQHPGVSYGTQISIDEELPLSTPVSYSFDGHVEKFTYSSKWFEETLDFPSILNNFIYIFKYTDILFRCSFVATCSKMGTVEAIFNGFDDDEYQNGNVVRVEQQTALYQMMAYHHFLLRHGIRIEDVFQWFFTTYLKEEFHIENYCFFAPSDQTTMLEKCKLLAVSIDEILKQYHLWYKHGSINPNLLSISSSTNKFADYSSREKQKYAYASSDAIRIEMSHLFTESTFFRSDGTLIEESLYAYLKANSLSMDDIDEWERDKIAFLLEQGSLLLDDASQLILNKHRTRILRDLHEKEVLCVVYCQAYQDVLFDLYEKGHIEYESTLFTRQEQELLDFKLNKASFVNGEDLRNKYVHGSYSRDEKQQQNDYFNFLMIIILIIIKINEEMCLADEQDEA